MLLLCCGLANAQTAGAQSPSERSDQALYLRLETGRHEATINSFALIPGTDTIVTASDDKSIRLWSAGTFESRGILWPPIGPRDQGEAYAVAASSELLAIGGRFQELDGHYAIALYSLPSQRPIGLIRHLPRPALALRFSASGDTLAAGLMDGGGLRLFDMKTYSPLPADTAFKGDVVSMDFSADGRLVVTDEDDGIRLYGADHHRMDSVLLPHATSFGVAFSPDGRLIAVGDRMQQTVHLFTVTSAGKLQPNRDLQGAQTRIGNLGVVAFSQDGRALFAAGSYKDLAGQRMIRRWSLDGRNAIDIPVATDTVTSLLGVGGGVLFTSAEPSLGRVDADKLALKIRSTHIDLRNAGTNSFRLSADGSIIEMPLSQQQIGNSPTNQTKIVFDVRARSFVAPTTVPPLALPSTSANGLIVTDWLNSHTPRINGRLLQLEPRETAHAVAVSPDGRGVAIGTDFYLRFVGPSGELWETVTPAPVWAVNVSGNGRVVTAGLGDGTVHWYSANTAQELLALYVDPLALRFVLWTPDGFFDHDHRTDGRPDGRSLIGYQFNSANNRSSEFVEIGQLYPRFFRPDLVGLAFRDDTVAHEMITDQRDRIGTVSATLSTGLPPQVDLVDACGRDTNAKASGCPDQRPLDISNPAGRPGVALETSADTLLIEYRLASTSGKLGTVSLRLNEAAIRPATFVAEEDAHIRKEEAKIPLGDGLNVIRLTPISPGGAIEGSRTEATEITVYRRTPSRDAGEPQQARATPVATRPHTVLYLLSVGVSHFSHPQLDLKNADHDARAIAEVMKGADPPVYDQAVITTLLNDQATASNILTAIQAIAANAAPNDLVMIFLAGHGQAVDGRYFFAPSELGMRDAVLFERAVKPAAGTQAESERAVDQIFRQEGLGQDQILAVLQTIKASRVALILDTCYSASIATQDAVFQRDLNTMVTNRIGQAAGRFILSSATTLAFDSADANRTQAPQDTEGHGLFTSFLLQALRGAADYRHKGTVGVDDLANYTQDKVAQATASMTQVQKPEFYFGGNLFFAVRTVSAEP